MTRREAIEASLTTWRDAERRLADDASGDVSGLALEVARHRTEFQRLSATHMVEGHGEPITP